MTLFLWLISLIIVGNFSTIILMKREGIKSLQSWTAVICVLVVPVVTFLIVSAIMFSYV